MTPMPRATPSTRSHAPFTLVLAGGGARGFAHAGVLSKLVEWELRPSAIVGVSMGAVVGAAYSLRPDWMTALMAVDASALPKPGTRAQGIGPRLHRLRRVTQRARAGWNMITGWGAPERTVEAGERLLHDLFGDRELRDCMIPVVACATDLVTGGRVVLSSGLAREVVYASSALAGILPPLERGGALLVDGVYTDVAPVDVARGMGPELVIAVDPSQDIPVVLIRNGAQALMRAMEICHRKHAELRFDQADLVITPKFDGYVDTLDFGLRSECLEAGARATLAVEARLRDLLQGS